MLVPHPGIEQYEKAGSRELRTQALQAQGKLTSRDPSVGGWNSGWNALEKSRPRGYV